MDSDGWPEYQLITHISMQISFSTQRCRLGQHSQSLRSEGANTSLIILSYSLGVAYPNPSFKKNDKIIY